MGVGDCPSLAHNSDGYETKNLKEVAPINSHRNYI
jgi:hypothetical protein